MKLCGFDFIQTRPGDFCNLIDHSKKIFVEVKIDYFTPAQLLYGLAKENIQDAKYIALANMYEIRFYKKPDFNTILTFAKSIDPKLTLAPSTVTRFEYHERAFEILGVPKSIYTYQGDVDLETDNFTLSINEHNYIYYKTIFDKYRLNYLTILSFLAKLTAENDKLVINKNGSITSEKGLIYSNFEGQTKRLESFVEDHYIHTNEAGIECLPIKDTFDSQLLEKTILREDDVQEILHKIDTLTPTGTRRKLGKFFTHTNIADIAARYIKNFIDPDMILEPFVGGGSLIDPLISQDITFTVNDIVTSHIDLIKSNYGSKLNYFSENFITTPTEEIVKKWIPGDSKKILLYSNPPFGTKSTNKLSGRDTDQKNLVILYGGLEQYGKGDLCIPAIAKMIEVIKYMNEGYLAFFSPLGIFCGRSMYLKLLHAILDDFEFIYGEIFSGDKFHDVKKNKPISLTIWKYRHKIKTDLSKITFLYEGSAIKFKGADLLKDYWSYDNRKKIKGEIAVQGNDRFNVQAPKMFHSKVEKGGSEVIPENLKKSLNIKDENIPDELAIGLWSITVGYRAIIRHYPIYVDNAHVHVPDFNSSINKEIITLAGLYELLSQLRNNYTDNKIRIEDHKIIFGGKRLSAGLNYLFTTFAEVQITDEFTVKKIVNKIKHNKMNEINLEIKKEITSAIEKKLGESGYWEYIPVSKKLVS